MTTQHTVSGFLAGRTYDVPSGYTKLIIQVMTWDRLNLVATIGITANGYSETVTTDSSGRAMFDVPSGVTYTISLTHSGSYLNDEDQLVVANNGEIAWVNFILNEPANQVFSNVTVSTWVSDNTYEDYPYRSAVTLNGVTANDVPDVIYDVEQATSGDYAPVATAYAGGIYLYSAVNDSITIPTILIRRGA